MNELRFVLRHLKTFRV